MTSTTAPQSEFSLSSARKIVGDLFRPNPVVYWTDFLVCWAIGVVCFRLVRHFELFAPGQIVLFLVSSLLFYRISIFTHELTHLRAGTFTAFRTAWNLLCGIPFLMPSFTYYIHIDHHRRQHYGTKADGEYLPLGTRPPGHILCYLMQPLVIPVLAVLRFGVLTPLTWISPRFRNLVHRRLSSMVSDPAYIRPLPTKRILRIIRIQELLCFLWLVGVVIVTAYRGWLVYVTIQAYLTSVVIIGANALRTLGAHRYRNAGGQMTFLEQLLDSINFSDRSRLALLWAPLGLKYHALHHIFPTLPYHAMGEAHRRLMRELPADSPYRQTVADSLPQVLLDLWRSARASKRRQTAACPAEVHQPATSPREARDWPRTRRERRYS